MKIYPMLRTVLILATFCLGSSLVVSALGQDVGADIGGGAGIFRPKNPETNKRTNKPTTTNNKPGNKPSPRPTRATTAGVEERAEDLLDKGNDLRDNRRFAEAEQSYQGVLKLKPRDARAAYGLGNVYSDQQ